MSMPKFNAVVIDARDNVATAIEAIPAGGAALWSAAGKEARVICPQEIPIYHKLAIRDIHEGDFIVKYGWHMGVAAAEIPAGRHVHVHNVKDRRENLEEVGKQ